MTKLESKFMVSPENIIRDLAVIGCSLRTNGDALFISGLTAAERNDNINISPDMKAFIMETLKNHKASLIEHLRDVNA